MKGNLSPQKVIATMRNLFCRNSSKHCQGQNRFTMIADCCCVHNSRELGENAFCFEIYFRIWIHMNVMSCLHLSIYNHYAVCKRNNVGYCDIRAQQPHWNWIPLTFKRMTFLCWITKYSFFFYCFVEQRIFCKSWVVDDSFWFFVEDGRFFFLQSVFCGRIF